MSELIIRAEQGVLGVMLRDTDSTLSRELESDDFGHPAHRAVFTAITDSEYTAFDTTEDRLTAVAGIAGHADVDLAWLRQLADTAPAAELAPEYARIVVQAGMDRGLADFAQPYREMAALAADPDTRAALTGVADALDAQAVVFTPASAIDTDIDVRVAVDISHASTQIRVELHREDQIIADLVQHPEQSREIAGWLDSDVFSTEQRRLTFEMAVSLAYDGDPFDTVTLAWHLQRARDVDRYGDTEQPLTVPAESDYAYLSRLHTATVATGTSVVVGRELLVEHVQATLALSAAEATERTAQHTTTAQQHVLPQQQQALQPPLSQVPRADIRPIEL